MKKYFLVPFAAFLLASCDDGDLIVTNFEFEDRNFQRCTGANNRQVFFKLNNDQSNEAIALAFNFQPASPNFLINEEGVLTIPLNNQNEVIYRTFDGQVTSSYYCSEIPPTSPNVVEEYRSTSGGSIVITSTLRTATDHDQDGVPSVQEGMATEQDTDGDGIPDYLDIDDDNDNVLTSVEIEVEAASSANGYPDSDGDGTPDYLDADDDNDGVITRYEDWNQNQNPADDRNDDNVPHYLNPEIRDTYTVDTFRANRITRSFRYNVNLVNLTLVRQGGDGEQIRIENYDFGFLDSGQETINLSEEDVEEEEQGG